MLQKFMDEVREGKREGSVAHTVDSLLDEDRAAWRLLRKELEDVGITPSVFDENKAMILQTLRDAIESHALQEYHLSGGESEDEQSASETSSLSVNNDFEENEPIKDGGTNPEIQELGTGDSTALATTTISSNLKSDIDSTSDPEMAWLLHSMSKVMGCILL